MRTVRCAIFNVNTPSIRMPVFYPFPSHPFLILLYSSPTHLVLSSARTMAAVPLIFFGDNIADLPGDLRRIRRSQNETVLLKSFLEQASSMLRAEIRSQPREVRYQIPSFTSILDLIERLEVVGMPHRGIKNALTFVCHLANFVG